MLSEGFPQSSKETRVPGAENPQRKGMLAAGTADFSLGSAGSIGREVVRQPERQSLSKEAIVATVFADSGTEDQNMRAALTSLVDESGVAWETFGRTLNAEGGKNKGRVRELAQEYLAVWRDTSNASAKNAEAVRTKFLEVISGTLH